MNVDAFDLPLECNAVITCAESRNAFIDEALDPSLVLSIHFADVEDPCYPGAITPAHARAIVRFIDRLPDSVTDLYVCCQKGGSRSPAMAAALMRASGRSDRDVWLNPYYSPNTLVYKTLCEGFGLRTSRLSVELRGRANERAYAKAVKEGGAGKYERWQILE